MNPVATAPSADSEFVPLRWLANGHAMTIAAAYWPRRFTRAGVGSSVRRVPVGDDARVDVEIDEPKERAKATLVLVHGLTGSARSHYMLGTAEKALARGLRVARMNLRGCGVNSADSSSLYHSGMSNDARRVVAALAAEYGGHFALAGFSLGGNLVAKLGCELGETPDPLVAIACVSAPLDLAACASRIDAPGLTAIYRRHFVRRLIGEFERRAAAFPDRFDPRVVRGVKTLWQFDDAVTAPTFGFRDAHHYYAECSAAPRLSRLRLPTLIISSQDDPIVGIEACRSERARGNSYLTIETPAHGGHLGFVGSSTHRSSTATDRFWAEERVVNFLAKRLFVSR